MKESILSLAMLIGLSGAAKAQENSETATVQSEHKIEIMQAPRTGAVDEIVTGNFKGINIEVFSHQLHQFNFVSEADSLQFENYVSKVAEHHGWPEEVARDISSRAMVYTVVKDNTTMPDVFAKTDKDFETKLGMDLKYIEDNGAEAYLQNRLNTNVQKDNKSISFEEARKNLRLSHQTPSGIKYFINGSEISFEGTIGGLQTSKLMPRYSRENSDKTDAKGFYAAYKRPDGKYQCGGSTGTTSNMAVKKESQMLQVLYAHDEICKDMLRRQNAGENLSASETTFMARHQEQLKKRNLCHDNQGNLIRQQENSQQRCKSGRSY